MTRSNYSQEMMGLTLGGSSRNREGFGLYLDISPIDHPIGLKVRYGGKNRVGTESKVLV